MKHQSKKSTRFIAGAVCPQCHQMDVIALLQDEKTAKEAIECVECGYFYDQISAQFESQSMNQRSKPVKINWHNKDQK